jgi:sec-independent protein translocase protein TatC
MSVWDHIEELRRRIIVTVGAIVVASVVLYFFSWEILEVVMAPVSPYLDGEQLNILGPFEAFTFRFKVALYAAIVLCSPIIIYQILAFFTPALRPREQKYFLPTFLIGVLLFLAGNAFAYFVVLGPAFEWMLSQADSDIVRVLPEASRYLTGVVMLLLGFGLAFEIPIVIFYLVAFDVVSYKKMRSSWRVAYVVLMIIAAVATPDWSPVTMGLLFGALLLLYESSLFIARIVLSKRIKAQAEAEAAGY